LIVKCPSYQQYIFSLFALKFSTLTTLIEDIKFKRLDSRILDFLKQKDETLIEITHEEIASNLGTSRVVISRVLKDLEHKNLIKLHRKKIELL
jgi:CRP/FNR family transcriptional regulator